jgi:arylsulfatase A-like enzyme
MKRRNFIKTVSTGIVALHGMRALGTTPDRPNILFIITDQQYGDGMSCVQGQEYLRTPNMDALAETGMRFTRAYSPNPLCMPMRTATFTGSFPHQTGIQSNSKTGFEPGKHLFLGKVFKDAGYETAYFGKWHIPLDTSEKAVHGFDEFEERSARLDPVPAARFLRQSHDRPFFAVASFLGPHEICEWARKEKIPGKPLGEVPPMEQRPPARANAAPPANETDSIALARKASHNSEKFPVGNYTEDDWRRHIWGYYRLIERVDGYIGTLLSALRESGLEQNTLVLFLSDHGDCHGAHRWNQKTVFYDESARVPFIVSQKGTTRKGTSDVLLNIGTDVFPTLCDFAGIEPPVRLPGKSLKKTALGQAPGWRRDYVVVQNYFTQGGPVDGTVPKIKGRMVRSDRFKYCLYSHGAQRESLVDMINDPGEMNNLAADPAYVNELTRHRAMLLEHGRQHSDPLALDLLNPAYIGETFKPAVPRKKKKNRKNAKQPTEK